MMGKEKNRIKEMAKNIMEDPYHYIVCGRCGAFNKISNSLCWRCDYEWFQVNNRAVKEHLKEYLRDECDLKYEAHGKYRYITVDDEEVDT